MSTPSPSSVASAARGPARPGRKLAMFGLTVVMLILSLYGAYLATQAMSYYTGVAWGWWVPALAIAFIEYKSVPHEGALPETKALLSRPLRTALSLCLLLMTLLWLHGQQKWQFWMVLTMFGLAASRFVWQRWRQRASASTSALPQ